MARAPEEDGGTVLYPQAAVGTTRENHPTNTRTRAVLREDRIKCSPAAESQEITQRTAPRRRAILRGALRGGPCRWPRAERSERTKPPLWIPSHSRRPTGCPRPRQSL